MTRPILDESHIHSNIKEKIALHHNDILQEVQHTVENKDLVIVGMGINPFPKRARKLLTEKGIPFTYLEYGNYFKEWRRRTALKMWTGWPTFPMIFVKGVLIGGSTELESLVNSGELTQLLTKSDSEPD